jgi:hypothetical protein
MRKRGVMRERWTMMVKLNKLVVVVVVCVLVLKF